MRFNKKLLIPLILFFFTRCLSEEVKQFQKFYSNGKLAYQNYCQNCHGAQFEGFASLYPPILDSFLYSPQQFCNIISRGYNKPLIIKQDTYRIPMPPIQDVTPREMAYILTYLYKAKLNKDTLFQDSTFTDCRMN